MTASKPRPVPAPAEGARAAPRDLYSRFIPREELSSFASWSFGDVSAGVAPGPAASEAEAPVDPAELHAQQLRAARQSGYQDGYRDGLVALEGFKQSFADQTTTQVGALVRSVGEQLDALQQEMARAIASTATALARQVLRSELATRPDCVAAGRRAGARRPAAERAPHRPARPSRRPRPHRRRSAEAIAARGARLVADASIARGGCRVESDIGLVDATIDERWRRAVASLGSELPWQDAPAGAAHAVILSEAKDPDRA